MDILTSAEMAISLVVERFLMPRRHLQPCELAQVLRRAILRNRHRLPFDTIVPNRFELVLPPADYQRMEPLLDTIAEDLREYIDEYIKSMNFKIVDAILIEIKSHTSEKSIPSVEVSFTSDADGGQHED